MLIVVNVATSTKLYELAPPLIAFVPVLPGFLATETCLSSIFVQR